MMVWDGELCGLDLNAMNVFAARLNRLLTHVSGYTHLIPYQRPAEPEQDLSLHKDPHLGSRQQKSIHRQSYFREESQTKLILESLDGRGRVARVASVSVAARVTRQGIGIPFFQTYHSCSRHQRSSRSGPSS